jgi:hypothetical protein
MRTIPMTPPIGLSPISIGSDVAISVRGPAAFTGIAALKATHGRILCFSIEGRPYPERISKA